LLFLRNPIIEFARQAISAGFLLNTDNIQAFEYLIDDIGRVLLKNCAILHRFYPCPLHMQYNTS
jgi:hypothetical protein